MTSAGYPHSFIVTNMRYSYLKALCNLRTSVNFETYQRYGEPGYTLKLDFWTLSIVTDCLNDKIVKKTNATFQKLDSRRISIHTFGLVSIELVLFNKIFISWFFNISH
jgi:hypothetical protein